MLPDLAGQKTGAAEGHFSKTLPGRPPVGQVSLPGPAAAHLKETEIAARSLGVQVYALEARGPDDLEGCSPSCEQEGCRGPHRSGDRFLDSFTVNGS